MAISSHLRPTLSIHTLPMSPQLPPVPTAVAFSMHTTRWTKHTGVLDSTALLGSRFCPLVCMVVDDRQNLAQSTCVRVVVRPLCMRYIGLPHSLKVYCDGSERFCRVLSPKIPICTSQCSGGRKYIMLCHFETSHGKSGDSRNIF